MPTDPFETWNQQELLSLFCSGCITHLIQQKKLSYTAMLAYPSLTLDQMEIYNELINTGWWPEESEVENFVHYLRVISDRDVRVSGLMVQ